MKNILVVAKYNKVEALRVAAGLTLLSDPVRVAVLGTLEDTPAINEQREMLEFAEVPCDLLADARSLREQLPPAVLAADVVYVI